ncbi:hypothetical protein HHL16_20560 [Pseudoflavitalea sp. G-6-1-2]|uniref:hypothetical protein n=1 Tax=Pseudoflavitalea sp. G-6-1-2 TaxID=2728841 RepID=UPI00146EBD22|nr:hypothetical protein [Pseudoflavitalea sp. G-6-1-2]NML23283.1 hypothetical protein [Pseudoflavitalea sp. G-6-1-2]
MTQSNQRITGGKLTALLVLVLALTACEKKIESTIPPDANTLKGDIEKTFNALNDNVPVWYWDVPVALTPGHLMSSFNKDSTSELLILQRYSLIQQLSQLYSRGGLSPDEQDDILNIAGYVNTYGDATFKAIVEDPVNAGFKAYVQSYLPNYLEYYGYSRLALAERPTYVVNGTVQLSLTFNNSTLLPQLKQSRQLDYDFRVFGYSKDSISLNGYYNTSSNKVCRLLAIRNEQGIVDYNNGATMMANCFFTRVPVSLKMDGAKLTVPANFRNGLSYFISKFRDGIMNKQLLEFSYELMNPKAPDLIEAFKDLRFCTVKSSFEGSYASAPAGATLITMNAYTAGGTKKVLEFIKE